MKITNPRPDSAPVCIAGEQGCRISEVIVFLNHAFVKRRASPDIGKGIHKLRIEIQAFAIDQDSPQANVFGEGEILGVQYKEIPVVKARQPELQELEDEKKSLDRQKLFFMKQIETIDKQKSFLDSFLSFSEIQIPKAIQTSFPSPDKVEKMVETLGKSYSDLFENEKVLLDKIEGVNEQITLVGRKLKTISQPGPKRQKVIEVLFESYKSQKVECQVSYVVKNAQWTPVYKADVPADLSFLKMTMFATISQKTGENWDGVDLSVSNALAMDKTDLPAASAWYVDVPRYLYQVAASAGAPLGSVMGDAVPMAAELEAGSAELEEMVEAPAADYQQATQRKLPLAFEYGFNRKIDLASGEDDAFLPIFLKEISSRFFSYAVPDSDSSAYLVCKTIPDQAILASRLNIHFDGRFVGTTWLKEQKAGKDLLINLGPDRGVHVRKEKIKDKISETFFGKVDRSTIAREFLYSIIVENNKEEPIRVKIEDAVPVSKTDRIQIKGITLSPEPDFKNVEDKEGVMLWDFKLKPGEIKKIMIGFGIKYPKTMSPSGL